ARFGWFRRLMLFSVRQGERPMLRPARSMGKACFRIVYAVPASDQWSDRFSDWLERNRIGRAVIKGTLVGSMWKCARSHWQRALYCCSSHLQSLKRRQSRDFPRTSLLDRMTERLNFE